MSLGSKDQDTLANKKGWITARPLVNYSSLHELSPTELMGLKIKWPKKHFFIEINLNLHTPLELNSGTYLTFHTRDADKSPGHTKPCFSISEFQRWRVDITSYSNFEIYLRSLIRWHRCNYEKSEKKFKKYGATVSVIEEDWTQHVDVVYRLYCNVAKRFNDKLYDLSFFQAAAKRSDYKLICAWFEDKMIGMFLLQEELPTLHSTCCGFDYLHSTHSYAYSWMHYALIHHAIESQKYHHVDIGLTADESKKIIGFKAIPACMDIYTNSSLTHGILQLASSFLIAKIAPDSKLKISFKYIK